MTGTIAIGGLAAWVWSEREHEEDESEYESGGKPPRPPPTTSAGGAGYSSGGGYASGGASGGVGPGGGTTYAATTTTATSANVSATAAAGGGEAAGYYDQSQSYREGAARTDSRDVSQQQQDESTWYGRVTGMMKRTPSPQQFFDGAAKQVTAGVGAVGGYLGGIMEEGSGAEDELRSERRDEKRSDASAARKNGGRRVRSAEEREGFSDHERWSEEAEEQSTRVGVVEAESERRAESARAVREERGKGKAKKAIAIVISAETDALQGMKVEDDDETVGEHPVSRDFVIVKRAKH